MKKKRNFKQWYEKQIKTQLIFNNEIYQKWSYKLSKNNVSQFILLFAKNVDRLKSIFGEQSATYLGEFRYYVWIVLFECKTFLVFSSNRGTSIEILYDKEFEYFVDDKEIGKIIVNFVEHLLKKLEESNDHE